MPTILRSKPKFWGKTHENSVERSSNPKDAQKESTLELNDFSDPAIDIQFPDLGLRSCSTDHF